MANANNILTNEIKQANREILLGEQQTILAKQRLINELKNGLAEQIKRNSGRVKIIKKTRFERFKLWFKTLIIKL